MADPVEAPIVYYRSAYSVFLDDLNNSQGFYVTPTHDGSVVLGGIRQIGEYSDEYHRNHCHTAELAAKFSVEEHNKKLEGDEIENGFLKFVKIVNLNVGATAGAMYYITMEAEDGATGELRHYEVKVWKKINTGFKVEMFRLARYWVKSSDKLASKFCSVEIVNLSPMNRSYLYYKCFYRFRFQPIGILGLEVSENEESGKCKCTLWFQNREQSGEVLKILKDLQDDGKINFDIVICG